MTRNRIFTVNIHFAFVIRFTVLLCNVRVCILTIVIAFITRVMVMSEV